MAQCYRTLHEGLLKILLWLVGVDWSTMCQLCSQLKGLQTMSIPCALQSPIFYNMVPEAQYDLIPAHCQLSLFMWAHVGICTSHWIPCTMDVDAWSIMDCHQCGSWCESTSTKMASLETHKISQFRDPESSIQHTTQKQSIPLWRSSPCPPQCQDETDEASSVVFHGPLAGPNILLLLLERAQEDQEASNGLPR